MLLALRGRPSRLRLVVAAAVAGHPGHPATPPAVRRPLRVKGLIQRTGWRRYEPTPTAPLVELRHQVRTTLWRPSVAVAREQGRSWRSPSSRGNWTPMRHWVISLPRAGASTRQSGDYGKASRSAPTEPPRCSRHFCDASDATTRLGGLVRPSNVTRPVPGHRSPAATTRTCGQ